MEIIKVYIIKEDKNMENQLKDIKTLISKYKEQTVITIKNTKKVKTVY